ncbi:hypothetical protein HYFRA_00010287 [Hymenoscyphus fraxineus]|uniref:NAD(P)-binding protein n=1 Tax=Hymenoscyphus fraxineus TaxID=746836 RepID=A0A9N9L1N2_9HELO|nr:hypothetical protein HYFRA_00010287 [Hymenoscyphus fraxineus]
MLCTTGAKVYMASRSKEKAEKTIQTLTSETPAPINRGSIHFLHLDLNDLISVKKAAETFFQQESRLDILWNNAGSGAHIIPFGARTVQNIESVTGTICVATLLFTTLLLPQLHAASPSRVVWTSSFLAEGASPKNGINLTSLEKGIEDRTKNYAVAKAGTWTLGHEFARRYGREGITSVIQNPGNLKTGAYDAIGWVDMLFLNPLLPEARFGAYTELFAGFGSVGNGDYVVPWGRVRGDGECPRKDLLEAIEPVEEGGLGYREKLWEWCEEKWKPYI